MGRADYGYPTPSLRATGAWTPSRLMNWSLGQGPNVGRVAGVDKVVTDPRWARVNHTGGAHRSARPEAVMTKEKGSMSHRAACRAGPAGPTMGVWAS